MRGFLVAAACCLALAPAQQPPAFRGGVSLVTVDVTVIDADGLPVPGLTAADFEVRLDNRAQPIRGVTYLQVAETMAGAVGPSFDAAPLPPSPAKTATTAPRVFVVLVDDLSFAPLTGNDLLAGARRFISTLPPTDLAGLATTSGTVTANPATGRASVLAALAKVTGVFQDPRIGSSGPSEARAASPDQHVGLAQALDIDRGDAQVLRQAIVGECFAGDTRATGAQSIEQVLAENTCARQVQSSATRTAAQLKATVQRQAQAIEAIVRAMRGAAGIRHLVILTGGVALAQDVTTMVPVARTAAEAGVQMSVLMAAPDISLAAGGRRPPPAGAPPQADTGAPQRRREDGRMLLDGARTTADMAGGELYQVTGVPDRFFERVRTAASAVYRLAVEVPPDTTPGKDFTLAARVLKTGLTARANRHAVAALPSTAPATAPTPAAPALLSPAEQMRRAVASGRVLNGVDVSIEPFVRRGADPAHIAIDVTIAVSGAARAPVSTMFGLVDAGGTIRTSDKTLEAPDAGGGYRLAFTVPVVPGSYRLRVAAADAGGAVGSAESAVDATLTKMGTLETSGIAIAALPGPRRGVLAAVELYPSDTPPADVLVKMTLVSGADATVERVVVPEMVDGVLRAEAEFLLDTLPPGRYTVRAAVLSGATLLGTLTRALPR